MFNFNYLIFINVVFLNSYFYLIKTRAYFNYILRIILHAVYHTENKWKITFLLENKLFSTYYVHFLLHYFFENFKES